MGGCMVWQSIALDSVHFRQVQPIQPHGSLGISVIDPLRFHFDTLRTQYKRYDRKLPRSTQPALAFSHGQSQ